MQLLDLTQALEVILRHYQRGYTLWISFKTDANKLQGLSEKWAVDYGARLAAYQRQDKKQKGLPTAVAVAAPVLGEPGKAEVILMATQFAQAMEAGPFSREKWKDRFPEFSRFVMSREDRGGGKSALTWRIKNTEFGKIQHFLAVLAKQGDSTMLAVESRKFLMYPMFGGVRRQLRRALIGSAFLWAVTQKERPWPGPDPEYLPMKIGFNRNSKSRS